MSGSKIFLFSCAAFIIGVFISLVTQNAQIVIISVLFFISFISCLIFRKLKWLIVFCLIFFIFGFLRADSFQNKIADNKSQNFYGQEVVLEGIVVREPEITQERQRLIIEIVRGLSMDASEPVGEKVLVHTSFYTQYQYGDKLRIAGRLEEPPIFKGFNYKRYLARKAIYSIIFSPRINILAMPESLGIRSRTYKEILNLRAKLRTELNQGFPSSQALLLGAMILGDRRSLTDQLKETLNRAGIRHLTAISGMHITILVNLLMLVFLGLGLWRKQAFWLTMIFILFFVIMTGFQPSTIRASMMGFFFLLGQSFGRIGDPLRIIIFGVVAMLAFNPLFLVEAGFQLSFLAVLGINYLTPIFSKWLRRVPNPIQLRNVLAMSLGAQIFTLPFLIYYFGHFSLVAPLTNILVLPLLPFIIVFGFLAAFFGIFSHFLALIFIFPCWLLLSYLLKIAEVFSSFAFSSIYFNISWHWLIAFYLGLAYLIWQWRRDHPFKILGF